jgi:hypothetical protein
MMLPQNNLSPTSFPNAQPSEGLNEISFIEFGLHCVRKPMGDMIVVFVHGILSSGASAWGYPSWPDLLASEPELQGWGLFVFTYQTSVASRTYSITDVSDALREHFTLADLWNKRKIVFVCHSMGGIVVRRFLVANQIKLIELQPTIGLFMVASPSLGSRDASLISVLSFALQHTQAAALRFSQGNTSLNELHQDFRTLLNSERLKIKGRELTEDRAITLKRWLGLRRQVVEPFSAAAYFHEPGYEPFRVPGSDHSTIVKPLKRDAIQHLMLRRFLLAFDQPQDPGAYLNPLEEAETARAYEGVQGLRRRFRDVVSKPEAFGALQDALFQTRQYVERRRLSENRDPAIERRLSQIWNEVGSLLQHYDPELASLCWIKGHGWANEKLWNDPRFRDLPVHLDDLLQRLYTAMQEHAATLAKDLAESRMAIEAIQSNLDRFEPIHPAMANLLGQPMSARPHAVIHRSADAGNAVEFIGYGERRKITINDLAKLNPDDRHAIVASKQAMDKLLREWDRAVRKGRLSENDNEELLAISSQMSDRLKLIFQVVEAAMGGQLEDHYAAQRAIAEFAKAKYVAAHSAASTA